MKITPTTIQPPETSADDPRLGQLLGTSLNEQEQPKLVIIGFPSDEGVKRNGGRPGAVYGPDEIRRELYKLTPHPEHFPAFKKLLGKSHDLGNVKITGNVEEDQQNLGHVLSPYLETGALPIILGGGHETAFGHFLGYAFAKIPSHIFNLDAHTDVRPIKNGQAHSGSPFRQALEYPGNFCKSYLVAGLNPSSVAESHLDYIQKRGGKTFYRKEASPEFIMKELRKLQPSKLMTTFDLDAVDQAFAPGVSAPAANGLSSLTWLTVAYEMGKFPQTTSFDIVELNPRFDRDRQTAKLAALTIWHFLLGVIQR